MDEKARHEEALDAPARPVRSGAYEPPALRRLGPITGTAQFTIPP